MTHVNGIHLIKGIQVDDSDHKGSRLFFFSSTFKASTPF